MRPAVFLDRDGTMVHEIGYLHRIEDVRWFPFTVDAIRLLNRAGFLVCVTTNQSGVALGMYEEETVRALHAHLDARLRAGGARVDGWYYCPHHPRGTVAAFSQTCDCRKPASGLVRRAAAALDIDVTRSFVIGDKQADLELAANVGARGVLVQTGHGADAVRAHAGHVPGAAHVATDLMEATSWLLVESGHPRMAS
jgi:D-glycero-D-manno-heptose 1,7-bisphosphate phosphatase